jgi:c-di-GMP-binding flagellar brake protein YcgR
MAGSQNPKHGKERRVYLRLKSYILVKYTKVGERAHWKTTNVKNISEGGLTLIAYERLPVSCVIKLNINLIGRRKPIDTYAKVARCTKTSAKEDVYHVGVAFLDIAESDRAEIAAQIELAKKDKYGRKLIEHRQWWLIWRKKKIKPIPGTKGTFFTAEEEGKK